jgi:hypothetical protein
MEQSAAAPTHRATEDARSPEKPPRRAPHAPPPAARALVLLGSAFLALASGAPASAEPAAEPAYPLDAVSREIPARGPFKCPKVELVDHRGDTVRFHPPAKVYSGFRDRLAKFELVVKEVGIEVYGRAPSRIVNLGTFNCRRMTTYSNWISEHGLGNAIDVEGFDFGPLPKGEALPAGLHKAFKAPFEVRVQTHWNEKPGRAPIHSRFLRTLAQRLIPRKDIFRVLLGPGYPGHSNHFHFDMASFRMVQIFDENGRALSP